tara:strand:+ start:1832 stop:2962 length:1131 start_codon:yes stop_codon:yes gene_type:complete
MAHITLAGTLRDPDGNPAVGDKVRFTHQTTTGETVKSAISVLTIDPSGVYSVDLEYGLVLVEYKDSREPSFKNIGIATVNNTNPATSIPELLNAVVPVSSAELIEFQGILADCVAAQVAAAASATLVTNIISESGENLSLGTGALSSNTTGASNTSNGVNSLRDNTTGNQNTAVGVEVLKVNTTGSQNIGIGSYTLLSNTTASNNTAIGHRASQDNTTGGNNTALGRSALINTTTGSLNTGIGFNARSSSAAAIGQVTLGDANVTALRCNVTSISSLSDIRDKTDVIDSPYGLDFINTIQPRQYKWETREENTKDGLTRIGFIAQELLEACQGENDKLDLVMTDNPEMLEANYSNLLPIMVQAIKDLSKRLEDLEG